MKSFLSVITFSAFLGYASALSCYACTSAEDNKCTNEQLIECNVLTAATGMGMLLIWKPSLQVIPSSNYQCYQLSVEQKTEKVQVVTKGCAYDSVSVCDGSPINAEQTQCKTCMEDACNGSKHLRPAFGALISVIAGAFLMMVGNKL